EEKRCHKADRQQLRGKDTGRASRLHGAVQDQRFIDVTRRRQHWRQWKPRRPPSERGGGSAGQAKPPLRQEQAPRCSRWGRGDRELLQSAIGGGGGRGGRAAEHAAVPGSYHCRPTRSGGKRSRRDCRTGYGPRGVRGSVGGGTCCRPRGVELEGDREIRRRRHHAGSFDVFATGPRRSLRRRRAQSRLVRHAEICLPGTIRDG
ncbi:unnamed protein product, partial [Laminaria digitata]